MDERHIKVKVTSVDFMLSEKRDEAQPRLTDVLNKLSWIMDKSGVNYAGLENINISLMLAGFSRIALSENLVRL